MFLNLFIVCSLFRGKNPNKIRSIISILKLSFSQNTSLLKCSYQMYIILQFSNKMYQTVELDGYVIMNLGSVVVLWHTISMSIKRYSWLNCHYFKIWIKFKSNATFLHKSPLFEAFLSKNWKNFICLKNFIKFSVSTSCIMT